MSWPLLQACLWHSPSLGLPQWGLDHVAGCLLYKSVLGARRQEKLRSVHVAQSIPPAISKATAQIGWGSPNTQPDGSCGRGPVCQQGQVNISRLLT